jgi:hypothetical protein
VEQFGDDWMRIRHYLSTAVDGLTESDRADLQREIRTVLSFRAPAYSGNMH